MSERVVYCPECDKRIALLRLSAGKNIRCLYCGATFTPSMEDSEPIAPGRPRKESGWEEDEVRERRRPRHRRSRKGGSKVWIGALLGGGLLFLLVCGGGIWGVYHALFAPTSFPEQTEDYAVARNRFKTKLTRPGRAPSDFENDEAPPDVNEMTYASGTLQLRAWVSPPPRKPGRLRPAVIFLHGGFAFGEEDWDMAEPFREAGFVVMTPIVRGENGQAGSFTLFYDEVDDVIAAADALAKLPYVDPKRIYLCGHSAGGTLALLASMTSDRFRAAAAFSGSPDQVLFCRHNPEYVVFDTSNPREYQMRSPLAYPRSFKCPVRMYYGSEEIGFRAPSKKTAELARKAGLDVEAISVPGDQFDMVEPAMAQCIPFFKQE